MHNIKRPFGTAIDNPFDREPKKSKTEPFPILSLPDELIVSIFSLLDSRSALTLQSVCQRFRTFSQDPSVLRATKAYDCFLPKINKFLTELFVSALSAEEETYKIGSSQNTLKLEVDKFLTPHIKNWIEYGSYYKEVYLSQKVFIRVSDGDGDYEIDDDWEMYIDDILINLFRPLYLNHAKTAQHVEFYLPATTPLFKLQKQITHLKVNGFYTAQNDDYRLTSDRNIEFIVGCKNLKQLELSNFDKSDIEDKKIQAIFKSLNLQKLTVSNNDYIRFNSNFSEQIALSTSIEEIHLKDIFVCNSDFRPLDSMSSLKKLTFTSKSKQLDPWKCILPQSIPEFELNIQRDLSQKTQRWLLHLETMPSLEKLTINLHGQPFNHDMSSFSRLKHLVITKSPLGLGHYQNFLHMNSLETLEIHHQLTDRELICFPFTLKTLRCLEGSTFSDLCLAAFEDLTVEILS